MINIYFANETNYKIKGILGDYRNISKVTQRKVGRRGNFELSVTFVDLNSIHQINKSYRNIDRPTDVISFAFLDNDDSPKIKGIPILLGDIYICVEKAIEQANEYGHTLRRELAFLFTHYTDTLLFLFEFKPIEKISLQQALQMQSSGAYLVDVRSPEEYEKGHLCGAINIPYTDIHGLAKEMLKDKNRKVIVYCATGKRSEQSHFSLDYLGYDVYYLGGIEF